MLYLSYKGYNISADTASKAIKAIITWINRKGRRFFTVEGTKALEVVACTLECHVRANDVLDVTARNDIVNDLSCNHALPHRPFLKISVSDHQPPCVGPRHTRGM